MATRAFCMGCDETFDAFPGDVPECPTCGTPDFVSFERKRAPARATGA